MPLTFTVQNVAADRAEADLLAVPVFAERVPGPGADAVDAALGGGLAAFMDEAGFDGKPGETLAVPVQGRLAATAAVLVGLGDPSELTLDALRRAAAAVAKRAARVRVLATTLLDAVPEGVDRTAAAQALAEGAALGAYQFLRYKGDAKPSKLTDVVVLGRGGARVQAALERGGAIAAGVAWARDVVNEPAAELGPEEFVTRARELLRGSGVKVRVLAGAQLVTERMNGLIGVGQGSARPPRMLLLTYEPERPHATLALAGKGVTFDSGGLSIKTASGMETMKTDMSGAAAVVGAVSVLAALGLRVRVLGYVPLVENMPSGTAVRPGDVITYRNGKTVEVLNTDAEGRLVLADALTLATEAQPDAVVDVATLTGACVVALGEKVAGLMGRDDAFVEEVRAAADRAGEAVWPLPLPKEYRKMLDSDIADLRNVGTSSPGGALTAGIFLGEFVGADLPWAHLDIAGPSRASADDGYVGKGGTGFGVRTLVELASTYRRRGRRA